MIYIKPYSELKKDLVKRLYELDSKTSIDMPIRVCLTLTSNKSIPDIFKEAEKLIRQALKDIEGLDSIYIGPAY